MADDPIPTTRDRSGTYDAIATAKPGEPLFPIQGGDPHGPATVEFWADLERSAARKEANAERAALRFRKAGDAEAIAWAMRAYQKGEVEAAAERQGYADDVHDDLDDADQRLRRARMIFVCAHGDLFHESVSWENIATIYGVMIAAHHLHDHIFQVLTKRTTRARTLLNDPHFWSLANSDAESNVMDRVDPLNRRSDDARATLDDYGPGSPPPGIWLGASVEDQQRADERIPHLLATPAAVRWLSCEPLLGPVDLTSIKAPRYPDEPEDSLDIDWRFDALTIGDYYWFDCGDGYTDAGDGPYREHRIDWVVLGGESGPDARPMHPDWARAIRDQCARASLQGDDAPVPFFFKQWGEWVSVSEQAGPGAHHHFDDGATVRRVGKKAAGRLLDGVEHNAMPEFRND